MGQPSAGSCLGWPCSAGPGCPSTRRAHPRSCSHRRPARSQRSSHTHTRRGCWCTPAGSTERWHSRRCLRAHSRCHWHSGPPQAHTSQTHIYDTYSPRHTRAVAHLPAQTHSHLHQTQAGSHTHSQPISQALVLQTTGQLQATEPAIDKTQPLAGSDQVCPGLESPHEGPCKAREPTGLRGMGGWAPVG